VPALRTQSKTGSTGSEDLLLARGSADRRGSRRQGHVRL